MDRIDFPLLNASLNATSGILLVFGWLAIRRRALSLHAGLMTTALAVSAVFLASYIYFHVVIRQGEATRFADQAPEAPTWAATTYYLLLVSHIILAAIITPLALVVAWLGWKDRLARHVRLARWALPLWLYVSVTGVVVYVMLYRLYSSP